MLYTYMYMGACSTQSHDSVKVCKSHSITTPAKAAFFALVKDLGRHKPMRPSQKKGDFSEQICRWLMDWCGGIFLGSVHRFFIRHLARSSISQGVLTLPSSTVHLYKSSLTSSGRFSLCLAVSAKKACKGGYYLQKFRQCTWQTAIETA